MANRKKLWQNDYMILFDDKTIGLSDGAGFIDEIKTDELRGLYKALDKIFGDKKLKCEFCNSMNIHTYPATYICDDCGYGWIENKIK